LLSALNIECRDLVFLFGLSGYPQWLNPAGGIFSWPSAGGSMIFGCLKPFNYDSKIPCLALRVVVA